MPANNLKFISPTMLDVGGAYHVRFRLSSTPVGSKDPSFFGHSRNSLAGIHPKERSTLRTPDDLFPHIPSIKKSLFIKGRTILMASVEIRRNYVKMDSRLQMSEKTEEMDSPFTASWEIGRSC